MNTGQVKQSVQYRAIAHGMPAPDASKVLVDLEATSGSHAHLASHQSVRAVLTAKTQGSMAAQAARWRPDPTKLADPAHAARLAVHSIAGRIQR
jgi:hypothetical protein